MPLHLIKLSVGTDSIEDLEDWIRLKFAEQKKRGVKKPERFHTTRMVPKRAEEILGGGSIFWVIRGELLCRERILDIRPFVDKAGVGRWSRDCAPIDVGIAVVGDRTLREGRDKLFAWGSVVIKEVLAVVKFSNPT